MAKNAFYSLFMVLLRKYHAGFGLPQACVWPGMVLQWYELHQAMPNSYQAPPYALT